MFITLPTATETQTLTAPAAAASWEATLRQFVAPLRDIGRSLNIADVDQRLVDYVLTGKHPEILEDLARHGRFSVFLFAYNSYFHSEPNGRDEKLLVDLYNSINEQPTGTVLRWAQCLAASEHCNRQYYRLVIAGDNIWPEALLLHGAAKNRFNIIHRSSLSNWPMSMKLFERLLVATGLPANALLLAAFTSRVPDGHVFHSFAMPSELAGFNDALQENLEVLRPLLHQERLKQQLHVLHLLKPALSQTLAGWAPELCEHATGQHKQYSALAGKLLEKCTGPDLDIVFGELRKSGNQGSPALRKNALRLMRHLATKSCREDAQAEAFAMAGSDKAASVRQLLDEWTAIANASTKTKAEAPPADLIDWSAQANRISDDVQSFFWKELNEAVERANEWRLDYQRRMASEGKNIPVDLMAPFDAKCQAQLKAYLMQSDPHLATEQVNVSSLTHPFHQAVLKLARTPLVNHIAIFKILHFFSAVLRDDKSIDSLFYQALQDVYKVTGKPTLLEIEALLREGGYTYSNFVDDCIISFPWYLASERPDADVLPFLQMHQARLEAFLAQPRLLSRHVDRRSLYLAAKKFPAMPHNFLNAIFENALGSNGQERTLAQAEIHGHSELEQRLIAALADRKADIRIHAAQWIGSIKLRSAVPALKAALSTEKISAARTALTDALQCVGHTVEQASDRNALLDEARKGMSKGLPEALQWLAYADFPTVRWKDSEDTVPVDALHWLVLRGFKEKSPEAGVGIRSHCQSFNADDRKALGQFILEAWLDEGFAKAPGPKRLAEVRMYAKNIMQEHPGKEYEYMKLALKGKSEAEVFQHFLDQALEREGEADISCKGILAITAACAGGESVPSVARFIKEWYGLRAAHCKALIAMLAWIDHPSAIQTLLSIRARFRTKGIQDEANRHIELLAGRKNWTVDELADRSIPKCGFDDNGLMALALDDRKYEARLTPELGVAIFNDEGRELSALPDPKKAADAEQAAQTKRKLNAARKEVKAVVAAQIARMYEAMCSGRQWTYEDWSTHMHHHPLMKYLVQGLIWCQIEVGKPTVFFRPLNDGTLSDANDTAINPQTNAKISLAHECLMSPEQQAQWLQHLSDFKIFPLFDQLTRGAYTLPNDMRTRTAVAELEGHVIEAFSLRSMAQKLGYDRRNSGDGGRFYAYEKRFPTIGLCAVIQFTGNQLPEENKVVALESLAFDRMTTGNSGSPTEVPLDLVPAIMLSECHQDLKQIADRGTGFDPDWRSKFM